LSALSLKNLSDGCVVVLSLLSFLFLNLLFLMSGILHLQLVCISVCVYERWHVLNFIRFVSSLHL